MGNIPSFTPKELIKVLERNGFVLKRIHGSHHYFFHPLSKKITVVPMHNKDLKKVLYILSLNRQALTKINSGKKHPEI